MMIPPFWQRLCSAARGTNNQDLTLHSSDSGKHLLFARCVTANPARRYASCGLSFLRASIAIALVIVHGVAVGVEGEVPHTYVWYRYSADALAACKSAASTGSCWQLYGITYSTCPTGTHPVCERNTYDIKWSTQYSSAVYAPTLYSNCTYGFAANFSGGNLSTTDSNCEPDIPPPDKTNGPADDCNASAGNPCNAATGNKYQTEIDYLNGGGTLNFARYYNSQFALDSGMGYGWTSSIVGRRLTIAATSIGIYRANGRGETFTKNSSGAWQGDADTKLSLTQDATGYEVLTLHGAQERYDTSGKLVSETDPSGRTTGYGYNTSNQLVTVAGPFGHTFTLGYDASGHVQTVTDTDGKAITYSYVNNNLTQVDFPDGTSKRYHYEDTVYIHSLTGFSYADSAGVITRFSTYGYFYNTNNPTDLNNGKAIRTEHAQTDNGSAQERFTLNYDSATQTTVTDAIGTQVVMTFNTNLGVKNLVSKVNQSDGKSVQQVFDLNNNLTCMKDEENRVTIYTYSATNQKLGMAEGLTGDCINPVNVPGVTRTTNYEYLSPTLDLPRFIRRPSVATGQTFETEMVYGDTSHPNLPTRIIQRGYTPAGASVSRAVTLGYNTYGQVNLINGPRTDVNDITTLEYYECTTGGACGQLMRVTNALGHITTYDLYDANGRLKQMTDPNGRVTTYTYDPRGRVKTITQTPTSGSTATTQYSYTPWGDVSQVIDPDGVTLNYQYDAAHDLRFIVDAAGNYIHYKYDLKGNRTGEDTHDLSGVLTRSVGYAYNLRNRLSQINLAGDITQMVHDAVGNLTSETDPNNHGTTHQYDVLNRLFKTVNALSQETNYGQDVNDRPTVVTAPNGLSTQYQYDDLGNLLKEISPDRGSTTYTYDTAGNVLSVKDARNITTTYAYDPLNRITLQQSSDANTPRYNYNYDMCFKGALCWIQQNNAFHLYFGYDGLGRQNYQLSAAGATWLFNMARYSLGGRLTSLTYPSGRTVDYQYDALGRVSQVSTTANGVTTILAKNFIHQPFGPVQSFAFGNNLSYWTGLDQAYQPVYQFSGPRFKRHDYDPAGNLQSLTDISGSAQTFGYSALNELASASDTQAGSYGNLSYSYLPNGNREQEIRNGTATTYYYYDNTNRLYHAGDSDWRLMDAAGNTTWSNGLWGVSYDGYGRLLSSSRAQSSYGYNAFNQRTRKTAGGVTTSFLYGPRGELQYETDGTNDKIYVYLDEMPLARIDNNSQVYYYHTDHLGTPQLITNSAGATVWKALYEPFGKATITTQTIQNNLRLAGMYSDAETGLYYWYSRYYDPKTGRGIQPDRMSVAEHVQRWQANQSRPNRPPLEINPYAYVANNPLRWIDRSGRVIETWEPSESITHDPIGWGLPPGPFGPVCGPAGADLATWIPDAHFGSGFSGACEEHDECYDCSGRPRKDCDDDFCKTLLQSCAAQYGSGLGRQSCDRMARAYCRAVRENGQQYYKK